MKTIVCSLAAVWSFGWSAVYADVVIYKGSLHLKGAESSLTAYPATVGYYLVVDYSAKEAQSVTFYIKAGQKLGEWEVRPFRFYAPTFVGGKPARVIVAGATTNTNATSFTFDYADFRGVKALLTIQKTPAVAQVSEPKSLTALSRVAVSSGGYYAADGVLTFNSAATLDANDAGRDVVAARQQIQDDLVAKGYSIP